MDCSACGDSLSIEEMGWNPDGLCDNCYAELRDGKDPWNPESDDDYPAYEDPTP